MTVKATRKSVLNNPLVYKDPTGNFAVVGALMGVSALEAAYGAMIGVSLGAVIGGWLADMLSATNDKTVPDYPGDDPTKAPEGYDWHGKIGTNPGDTEGSYHNPDTGESLRPHFTPSSHGKH